MLAGEEGLWGGAVSDVQRGWMFKDLEHMDRPIDTQPRTYARSWIEHGNILEGNLIFTWQPDVRRGRGGELRWDMGGSQVG
jgi:hypothetical protein